jgi:hypothetical protein
MAISMARSRRGGPIWPSGNALLLRPFCGQRRFPMAIVGYGRSHRAHLPAACQRRLQYFGVAPDAWGVLFALDGGGRRCTLHSADPQYTAVFAPAAHA